MKYSLLFLLSFISFQTLSQPAIFLGFEIAPTKDVYSYGGIYKSPRYFPETFGSTYGVSLGLEINDRFTVMTGVHKKFYTIGADFIAGAPLLNTNPHSGGSNHISTYQIPLRLRTTLGTIAKRVRIFLTSGIHLSTEPDAKKVDGLISYSELIQFPRPDAYGRAYHVRTRRLEHLKSFLLMEHGVGFEFLILDKIIFTVSSSYYLGTRDISEISNIYEFADQTLTSNIITRGSYWDLRFGMRYPIFIFNK